MRHVFFARFHIHVQFVFVYVQRLSLPAAFGSAEKVVYGFQRFPRDARRRCFRICDTRKTACAENRGFAAQTGGRAKIVYDGIAALRRKIHQTQTCVFLGVCRSIIGGIHKKVEKYIAARALRRKFRRPPSGVVFRGGNKVDIFLAAVVCGGRRSVRIENNHGIVCRIVFARNSQRSIAYQPVRLNFHCNRIRFIRIRRAHPSARIKIKRPVLAAVIEKRIRRFDVGSRSFFDRTVCAGEMRCAVNFACRGGSIQIFEIRGIQKFPPLRMRLLTALRKHAARKRQRADHGKDCRRAFCCLFVCHKFPPCGKTSPPALPYIGYLYGF